MSAEVDATAAASVPGRAVAMSEVGDTGGGSRKASAGGRMFEDGALSKVAGTGGLAAASFRPANSALSNAANGSTLAPPEYAAPAGNPRERKAGPSASSSSLAGESPPPTASSGHVPALPGAPATAGTSPPRAAAAVPVRGGLPSAAAQGGLAAITAAAPPAAAATAAQLPPSAQAASGSSLPLQQNFFKDRAGLQNVPSTALLLQRISELPVCASVDQLPPQFARFSRPLKELLIRAGVSAQPIALSPFECVLSRHPMHRETSEPQLKALMRILRETPVNAATGAVSAAGAPKGHLFQSPFLAMRYSETPPGPIVARAGGSLVIPKSVWGAHPVIYVLSGGARGEALGQLASAGLKSAAEGALRFHLLTQADVRLSEYDLFLLTLALNAEDPWSRRPNFSERLDQVATVFWELCNRRSAAEGVGGVGIREIAAEICLNPLLGELRTYLRLDGLKVPILPLNAAAAVAGPGGCGVAGLTAPQVLQQLLSSRQVLSVHLPAGYGAALFLLPEEPSENLDLILDMLGCVCPERLRLPPALAGAGDGGMDDDDGVAAGAENEEGFLHPRAEEQLRSLFRECAPCIIGSGPALAPRTPAARPQELGPALAAPAPAPPAAAVPGPPVSAQPVEAGAAEAETGGAALSLPTGDAAAAGENVAGPTGARADALGASAADAETAAAAGGGGGPGAATDPDDLAGLRRLIGYVFASIKDFSGSLNDERGESDAAAEAAAGGASMSDSPSHLSSRRASAKLQYWARRVAIESSPGRPLDGLWNFPTTTLLVLFYIHFVSRLPTPDGAVVQARIGFQVHGRILYRCVAELAVTLAAERVRLNASTAAVRTLVLEALGALYRFAISGEPVYLPPRPAPAAAAEPLPSPATTARASSEPPAAPPASGPAAASLEPAAARLAPPLAASGQSEPGGDSPREDAAEAAPAPPPAPPPAAAATGAGLVVARPAAAGAAAAAPAAAPFGDWDSLFFFIMTQWLRGTISGWVPLTPIEILANAGRGPAIARSNPPAAGAAGGDGGVSADDPGAGAMLEALRAAARLLPPARGVRQPGLPQSHARGSSRGGSGGSSGPSGGASGGSSLPQPGLAPVSSGPAPWFESRRLDASATLSRLRLEVERRRGLPGARVIVRSGRQPAAGAGSLPCVEWSVEDPTILPMAPAAKVEFVSLVFGVVGMLVEKASVAAAAAAAAGGGGGAAGGGGGGSSSSSSLYSGGGLPIVWVSVPGNMIILAAIKVALTFVPPHFDQLCPTLVDWMKVRSTLALWLWETSKMELISRADSKWRDLAQLPGRQLVAARKGGAPAVVPLLQLRFVGPKPDPKSAPVRAPPVAAEISMEQLDYCCQVVTAEVIPRVVRAMALYIQQNSNLTDDAASKQFFTMWLRGASAGAGAAPGGPGEPCDVIAMVNALMFSALRRFPVDEAAGGGFSLKRPRADGAAAAAASAAGAAETPSRAPPIVSAASLAARAAEESSRAKRARRSATRYDTAENITDWLESLPVGSRARLEETECPSLELARATDTALPDLLRWKPPQAARQGNRMCGPPFDADAWRAERMRRSAPALPHALADPLVHAGRVPAADFSPAPLSDFDWKITKNVLKLLSDRGVDALVSRCRQRVFYLDRCTDGSLLARAEKVQGDCGHSDSNCCCCSTAPATSSSGSGGGGTEGENSPPSDSDEEAEERSRRAGRSRRPPAAAPARTTSLTALERRYGPGFGAGDRDLLNEAGASPATTAPRRRRRSSGSSSGGGGGARGSSGSSSEDDSDGGESAGSAAARGAARLRMRVYDDADLRLFLEFRPGDHADWWRAIVSEVG